MRSSSFTIISWTKLEVSALFQSAQHVRNKFCYNSVNDNNARPKDSKKNGNFKNKKQLQQKKTNKKQNKTKKKKKTIFTPKGSFFFFIIPEFFFCLLKTILCHTRSHANLTFIRVTDKKIWPEKETIVRLKMPRKFPITTNNL